MHILYIVGNRPQFIKLAILHKQVKLFPFIKESIIHTGQHFSPNMSDVFFKELTIEIPIINLFIHSVSHVAMIGRTMVALEPEILKLNPNLIVVFGDTNATLAGALTGKKLNIPVIHIEAGIRTFVEEMPEETNRYITDRIADINFCCTYLGVEHLKKEGIGGNNISSTVINSGDLMLDAFCFFNNQQQITKRVEADATNTNENFILTTIHRRQNIDNIENLKNIILALNTLNNHTPVVCPLHPNTKNIVESHNIKCEFSLLPPQGYLNMQALLSKCKSVITDSGGLQREAFFAKKPVLILMEKPFWPEVMEHGCSVASSSSFNNIIANYKLLQNLNKSYDTSVFGNGKAAEIIINTILDHYKKLI